MRILLTNDDGYHAPGLAVLERIARTLSDDIWIVAPAEEQSGTGRSLTITRPVRVRRFAERRFAVTGTPTDAVMMALAQVMDARPDLILSGVNRGNNAGENAVYSGTVGGAMEAALQGLPAIALSQFMGPVTAALDDPFEAAAAHGAATVRRLAPLIRHVHLEDIAATRVHHHLVPGEGVIDFHSTLAALKEVGYAGWVTIELYTYHENPDDAARTARERVLKIAGEVGVTFG